MRLHVEIVYVLQESFSLSRYFLSMERNSFRMSFAPPMATKMAITAYIPIPPASRIDQIVIQSLISFSLVRHFLVREKKGSQHHQDEGCASCEKPYVGSLYFLESNCFLYRVKTEHR